MKTYRIFIIFICAFVVVAQSCKDELLNTAPTADVSGEVIFKDANAGYVALNGIYRYTYVSGWSIGNEHQNFGIMSTALYTDLMGEDMVQHEQGNGWFWYDYVYNVRSRYATTSWRSYATWNFYYTLISNANYILAAIDDDTPGDRADVNSVLGQAYAIRAFSYFYLIQIFQKTYIGHENDPGVPLYTEPTSNQTKGNPRGTVQQVYTQINSDINRAIEYLQNATPQKHKSHIDYYVANGIKTRIALVQGNWAEAETAAKAALSKNGLSVAGRDDILNGFNSVDMRGVMWGAEVIEDQATIYASFFAHMDAEINMYAYSSRKCISNWLYDQIPATDSRKNWWKGPQDADATLGEDCGYVQLKFKWRSPGSYASDYIYMRAEEMVVSLAEALCRQGKYAEARTQLAGLGNARDPRYDARLAGVSDENTQSFTSTGRVSTLLDEILVQRRIELWCETGRIFDILRLKKGFYRDWTDSNHPAVARLDPDKTNDPEWWDPILTIPQAEFDGNVNMNPEDQNGGL